MATSTLGSGTLVLAGTTSGTTTVTATAVAGTTTLTLPAATDTLVGRATTDTLTNKTLTTPSVSSPTISDGTANGVAYLNGSKVLTTGSALVFNGSNFALGVSPSTNSANTSIEINKAGNGLSVFSNTDFRMSRNVYDDGAKYARSSETAVTYRLGNGTFEWYNAPTGTAGSAISFTQAMTLDASGNLLVGKTAVTVSTAGAVLTSTGRGYFTAANDNPVYVNRLSSDGSLIDFAQDTTVEGSISVSGTTVSYNGGHLSRWAQTTTAKDDSIVKGTVLSNLDEMNVYTKDGQPVANEQLNKVKVSDTEGDANVAGVFVNWSHDEDHNVDEINMAMTGDMIIRIAQGVTVARGDLLMSAGDGTAKSQGDDIVRSKTVAKVTSTHVTCTYADGSYCVPCVLMAC